MFGHTHTATGAPRRRREREIEVLVPGESKAERFLVEEFRGDSCDEATQAGACMDCHTNLYDDADPFLTLASVGWTDAQLAAVVAVHRRARDIARECGRDAYRRDLLKFLGAAPREGA
jgi:hypothetical protein